MNFNTNHDGYNDFFFVMENETPQNRKVEILSGNDKSDSVNFLRFSACLQDFPGTRNRNRRLWKKEHVETMLKQPHITELMQNGSFCGEAGHPTATTGQLCMERLMQVDPNNTSHRIISWEFKGNELHGVIETLDQGPGSPGIALMKNIIQGVTPAFSARTMVPQRKNADGSIDVMGPGRLICYDRVYLPGHQAAYKDNTVPVKKIVTPAKFDVIMESFTDMVLAGSEKLNRIIDDLSPVMESASYDLNTDMIAMSVDGGTIFVKPELKYRNEIRNTMNDFKF